MTDEIEGREGYVVRNAEGKYLTRSSKWYSRGNPGEAFVFSNTALEGIIVSSQEWSSKPAKLIPAVYIPEHKVTVPAQTRVAENFSIDISKLSPLEALKVIPVRGAD